MFVASKQRYWCRAIRRRLDKVVQLHYFRSNSTSYQHQQASNNTLQLFLHCRPTTQPFDTAACLGRAEPVNLRDLAHDPCKAT